MDKKISLVEELISNSQSELKAISIPKTSEIIAGHIRDQIISGKLDPGDHLLPESQLMEQFSTSRPTIREAFRILETEQFISVRRGARHGAEVHLPSAATISKYAGYILQAHNTPLRDLYIARYAIEPAVARMLAENSNPDVVNSLNEYISEIEDKVSSGMENSKEQRLAFLHFHLRMVELTGNQAMMLLLLMLEQALEKHQLRQETPIDYINATPDELRKKASDTLRTFRKLVRYIEKSDATRAANLWREHVREINANWLAGFEETTIYEVMN